MSNIAGKAYAMNVITPIKPWLGWINRIIFWIVRQPIMKPLLLGLVTLSMIHYARWTMVKPAQFPRLDKQQPEETIRYFYLFFFSNFNGSWEQYVDSFHMAIPGRLDLAWWRNVKYPKSVPLQPFHEYITYNQIWTNHYYNAYPMAASNDVKSAKRVKAELLKFIDATQGVTPEIFQQHYNQLLRTLQHDFGLMAPTPIVSLSAEAVEKRREKEIQTTA